MSSSSSQEIGGHQGNESSQAFVVKVVLQKYHGSEASSIYVNRWVPEG